MLATASDPRLPGPVQLFQRVFCERRPEVPFPFEQVYSPDAIFFEDPLHRADGLDAVRRHFERLNANLRVCHFEYGPAFVEADEAVLSWSMKLELRRGPRQPVVAPGMTHLRFADRISYQRDHFDAGALVYEHVPLLGWIIRSLKRRLQS